MTRYARAPSPEFHALLAPGALLSPLVARRMVLEVSVDVHLREDDHVHVYCGLTRLLDVFRRGQGSVAVVANPVYSEQECGADLFRDWSTGDVGFAQALDQYLTSVEVANDLLSKEGIVQAQWGAVLDPWIPFDREAVVGYADTVAHATGRTFSELDAAWAELAQTAGSENWAPRPAHDTTAKLDQLAVDPEGRLVLVELKFGGAEADTVYQAPLELLHYVHEWADVYPTLKSTLQSLIEARQSIGLSPTPMPALGDRLRPVIGFGAVLPSAEVMVAFGKILEIANRHLPALSEPIEAWTLAGDGPKRLL